MDKVMRAGCPPTVIQRINRSRYSRVRLFADTGIPAALANFAGRAKSNPVQPASAAGQRFAIRNIGIRSFGIPLFWVSGDETAAAAFTRLGIIEDARLEKYLQAYRTVQNNRLLLWALMTAAHNARLEEKADYVYNATQAGKL
jgi:hypothetical protein